MSDIPKPSEARCSHGVLITQVCAKCVAKNAEKDKGKGKK